MTYQVLRARHNWAEDETFFLSRPNGTDDWLFLHFKSPVLFRLADAEEERIEAGTCILLTPKTPHAFAPIGGKLLHDWVHFLPLKQESFSALKIDQNVFLHPQETGFITDAIHQIEQEVIRRDRFFERSVSAAAETLFVTLARSLQQDRTQAERGGHRADFEQLRLDLYRHPNRYANTLAMARTVSLSRSRFSVLYQSIFHIAPMRDLIRARTERASYYLTLQNRSISEIAELCGYQNEYHFIRQFKAETGITPGAFRKQKSTR